MCYNILNENQKYYTLVMPEAASRFCNAVPESSMFGRNFSILLNIGQNKWTFLNTGYFRSEVM